jgi:hypothetical protein
MLKKLLLLASLSPLLACSWLGIDEKSEGAYPCLDGKCHTFFKIDPWVSPGAYRDVNDYWHIKYEGIRYFTIMGQLDELHPQYVINDVPLVEVQYDSDYWVTFENISFKIPIYSVLSWFNDKGFNNPIPIGERTITLKDISKLHPPLNIAGYQIQKNFCWECPYAERALGTYSKYTYRPRQQFFLDKRMEGDTLKVMMKVTFNNDLGESEVVESYLNIIVDK